MRFAAVVVSCRERAELRAIVADQADEWVSPAQWARANGCSVDTVSRRVAAGEIEARELGRTPLVGADGQQLRDRDGRPRYRRMLRLRLTRPASAADVRAVAAEMVKPANGAAVRGRGKPEQIA